MSNELLFFTLTIKQSTEAPDLAAGLFVGQFVARFTDNTCADHKDYGNTFRDVLERMKLGAVRASAARVSR